MSPFSFIRWLRFQSLYSILSSADIQLLLSEYSRDSTISYVPELNYSEDTYELNVYTADIKLIYITNKDNKLYIEFLIPVAVSYPPILGKNFCAIYLGETLSDLSKIGCVTIRSCIDSSPVYYLALNLPWGINKRQFARLIERVFTEFQSFDNHSKHIEEQLGNTVAMLEESIDPEIEEAED
jgi:hypothetical protein